MIRVSNKLAKRNVRHMRRAAIKNEMSYQLHDCWGNIVGTVSRDGTCHKTSISLRTVTHIVVGMLVTTPRNARGMTHIKALRDIRALKPWSEGGLG